jgi:hypothetical protein
MPLKAYATVTGIVFLLVALAHLLRVLAGLDFRVGTWDVPTWGSIIALAVAGYLSFSGLRLARRV